MLTTLGWDAAWADALAAVQDPALVPARVMAVHRGLVAVRGETLDERVPVLGDAGPAVGDWVGVREGAVRAILPRRTALEREDGALVANAEACLILSSLNLDLNLRRTERFAALAAGGGMEVTVVLTKGDLAHDPAAELEQVRERMGGDVIVLSALDGSGLPALRSRLRPGRTHVLVGSSGVGKSTLINLLLGEERQRTAPVRESDDRGRHATTHRELFVLDDGALVIDTPGLRLPKLAGDEGLEDAFADVTALAAACRFGDCRHEQEPGCAVRGAIDPDRLQSLRRLEHEGLTARERRERGRGHRKDVRARTRPRE